MRYVALSIRPDRIVKLRRFIPEVEVFPGVEGCGPSDYRQNCIPLSYRNAAATGKTEGWGRDVIFMQDDVWIPHGPGFDDWINSYTQPLVVLGKTESTGIVIPKAFTAAFPIWGMLADVWTGEGRIGPAWMSVVEEWGVVLDVTQQL